MWHMSLDMARQVSWCLPVHETDAGEGRTERVVREVDAAERRAHFEHLHQRYGAMTADLRASG